jgi:phosphatidylserine/phosphatidylglycerophosphate/cardiolipin synthase-like enzyme
MRPPPPPAAPTTPRPRAARAFAAVALGLALALFAAARAGEPPAAELVQSAPEGTPLAEPGLRFARDVWVDLVDGAKTSIDTAQFYLANAPKSALEPVIAALERAGARGVKVRVLVSNKMVKQDQATFDRLRAIAGAEVKTYDLAGLTGGILHAKYWIVDRAEVFVGSQNFDWRSLTHIHETGLRVRDARIAAELGEIFETDWKVADTGALPTFAEAAAAAPGGGARPEIELVASPPALTPPGIRPALEALIELLRAAKKTIRIQTLEYAPDTKYDGHWPEIDDALRAAAKRGVKVELLVSDWNTEKGVFAGVKALHGVENVAVKVITIPLAKEGFIPYARVCHSKYMVVDDEILWVGTSNWSKSYFTTSRNVELIARKKDLAAQAAHVFARLWTSPYAEALDPKKSYPKPRKGE